MNRHVGIDVAYGKPIVLAVLDEDRLPQVDVYTLDIAKSKDIIDRIVCVTEQLIDLGCGLQWVARMF